MKAAQQSVTINELSPRSQKWVTHLIPVLELYSFTVSDVAKLVQKYEYKSDEIDRAVRTIVDSRTGHEQGQWQEVKKKGQKKLDQSDAHVSNRGPSDRPKHKGNTHFLSNTQTQGQSFGQADGTNHTTGIVNTGERSKGKNQASQWQQGKRGDRVNRRQATAGATATTHIESSSKNRGAAFFDKSVPQADDAVPKAKTWASKLHVDKNTTPTKVTTENEAGQSRAPGSKAALDTSKSTIASTTDGLQPQVTSSEGANTNRGGINSRSDHGEPGKGNAPKMIWKSSKKPAQSTEQTGNSGQEANINLGSVPHQLVGNAESAVIMPVFSVSAYKKLPDRNNETSSLFCEPDEGLSGIVFGSSGSPFYQGYDQVAPSGEMRGIDGMVANKRTENTYSSQEDQGSPYTRGGGSTNMYVNPCDNESTYVSPQHQTANRQNQQAYPVSVQERSGRFRGVYNPGLLDYYGNSQHARGPTNGHSPTSCVGPEYIQQRSGNDAVSPGADRLTEGHPNVSAGCPIPHAIVGTQGAVNEVQQSIHHYHAGSHNFPNYDHAGYLQNSQPPPPPPPSSNAPFIRHGLQPHIARRAAPNFIGRADAHLQTVNNSTTASGGHRLPSGSNNAGRGQEEVGAIDNHQRSFENVTRRAVTEHDGEPSRDIYLNNIDTSSVVKEQQQVTGNTIIPSDTSLRATSRYVNVGAGGLQANYSNQYYQLTQQQVNEPHSRHYPQTLDQSAVTSQTPSSFTNNTVTEAYLLDERTGSAPDPSSLRSREATKKNYDNLDHSGAREPMLSNGFATDSLAGSQQIGRLRSTGFHHAYPTSDFRQLQHVKSPHAGYNKLSARGPPQSNVSSGLNHIKSGDSAPVGNTQIVGNASALNRSGGNWSTNNASGQRQPPPPPPPVLGLSSQVNDSTCSTAPGPPGLMSNVPQRSSNNLYASTNVHLHPY